MNTALNLHLKNHCIETEAKNLFKKMMDEYFSVDDENGEIEDKIDLLREFIENSDFSSLRASDERLSGQIESEICLLRNSKGAIEIKFT